MNMSPWSGSWWAAWWHNTVGPPGNNIASAPRWALTCNPRRPSCPARLGDDSLTPQTEGGVRTVLIQSHTNPHNTQSPVHTVTFNTHCKARGITSHPACCTMITKSKSSDTILRWPFLTHSFDFYFSKSSRPLVSFMFPPLKRFALSCLFSL